MGQKTNPYSLRLGINQVWNSNYFAPKEKQLIWLKQDKLIRDLFFHSHHLDIIQTKIERTDNEIVIFLQATNTNLISGENNQNLNLFLQKIRDIINNSEVVVKFHLIEENRIYSSAKPIANLLAKQIEERSSFRLAVNELLRKMSFQRNVQGIKIRVNGRDGSDISRHSLNSQGKMPLNTLKAKISYGKAEAKTIYGQVGIHVWIYQDSAKEYRKNYNDNNRIKRNVNPQKN